jgi:hypothetical protein
LTYLTPDGTGGSFPTANPPDGVWTGPKPETSATVVANLSCDAAKNGDSYFQFTGSNQMMVTVNSQGDGITTTDGLEQAANAFVKTYMATGGNVEEAVKAANKALSSVPIGVNKQNEGDEIKADPVKKN